MNLGTGADSRHSGAALRRRQRRSKMAIAAAAVLAAGVVTSGMMLALGVIPSAVSRPARVAARHSAAPRRPPPARPPVGTTGSYAVASQSMLFVDRSRPALGARDLPTLVRYPVVPPAQIAAGKLARGPFPLVIFAPGYLQCGSSYGALLHAWASAGYVVATVRFPRTYCHIRVPDEADLSNQPADLAVVITRLLAISGRPSGLLAGLIDPARIAVAGHSDGGDAAAAVAANTCCRDHRVIAALILSGARWPPLGGRYFPPGTPPMLFVQGTDDTWNLPSASTALYQADTTGIRYYLTLEGADHFAPYEGHGAPEPLVATVTLRFLNAYLDGQAAQVSALRSSGNVPGTAVLTTAGQLPESPLGKR